MVLVQYIIIILLGVSVFGAGIVYYHYITCSDCIWCWYSILSFYYLELLYMVLLQYIIIILLRVIVYSAGIVYNHFITWRDCLWCWYSILSLYYLELLYMVLIQYIIKILLREFEFVLVWYAIILLITNILKQHQIFFIVP